MKPDQRFLNFFNWLLQWEGTVYENDPDDPGGATKFGIDQRSHPRENIRNLTRERAAEIYWKTYWTAMRCHEMPLKVGEVVGNIAVNAGPGRASKWLQTALGVVADGQIGPKTMAAFKGRDPEQLANALLERTEQHYRSIANGRLAKFLRGWLNRNRDMKRYIDRL
jgi:lysozyme family protein